jgi:hypothetical protein
MAGRPPIGHRDVSTPAKPGRPLTLTKALQDAIVKGIAADARPVDAALAAGVPKATFCEWVQRGNGEHPSRHPTETLKAFVIAIAADTGRGDDPRSMVVRMRRLEPR